VARTATLLQLRTDIAAQADVVVGSSTRYTSTLLNRLICQSIQRFRERVSTEGMTHYLVATTGTMTSGATSPYAFKVLDLSAVSPNVVRVYGVDITVSNVVRSLVHVPFQSRNDYGGPNATGEPEAWAMFQTTSIAIMPAPSESYFWTVWYLPLLADLSDDADTFDGVAGWEQWIVWDVVCNLIARDTYATAYALASQQRDAVWQDVIRGATKVTSAGGAVVGRDTLRATTLGRRRGDCGPVTGGSGLPPDGSVTNAMLASAPAGTTKGRMLGAGAGSPTDLTPGQLARNVAVYSGAAAGLVPTGAGSTTLFLREDGTWAAPSIGGSVSGLTLSQIQNIPEPRLLGRFSLGTGAVEALTPSQVGTMLAYFSSGTKGIVAGPTAADGTKFLRDDNLWATPPGGAGGGVTGASPSAMFAFAPLSVLGNSSSASGVSEFLNRGQVASLLPLFGTASGSTRGLVYSPTAGVANRFLRDDGSFQGVPSFTPTGIQLAQLAAIPESTILGRTSPSGIPQPLTPAQVATLLPAFTASDKGLVPASGGGTDNFLRADGTFAAPPAGGGGGGGGNPGLPTMSVQYNLGSGVFGGATGFLFSPSGFGLQLAHNLRMPTGTILLGATGAAAAPQAWVGGYSGAFNIGLGTGTLNPAVSIESPSSAEGLDPSLVRFRAWDEYGYGAPREWMRITRSQASGTLGLTLGLESSSTTVRARGPVGLLANNASGIIRGFLGVSTTEAFAARPGHHAWSVSGSQKLGLDNGGLSIWGQVGAQLLAHGAPTDKLGAWTPSGFATVATGIYVGASGCSIGVGSGGPQLSASGISLPTGSVQFGASGVASKGDIRGTQRFEMWSRRADGSADLPIARMGAATNNRLTIGGGTEGIAGLDLEATSGNLRSRIADATKVSVTDSHQLHEPGIGLALQQLLHSATTDKLATWTASGFANVATGITLGASGYQLSVGSGGPLLTGSGIGMRSGDIESVRRINGLDGIKVFGFITGGGAASGTQNIVSASGSAFVISPDATVGQKFALVPTLATLGDALIIDNRSPATHAIINAVGTGVGIASGTLVSISPSMGVKVHFASGAWAFRDRYQLGG
jgi:hypothetical protein